MIDSLETLKTELVAQKTAIEAKGGTVTVSGNNPKPSEITAGIQSISTPQYSLATATETDVVAGKTFFSSDNSLRTGALSYSPDELKIVTFYGSTASIQNEYNVIVPSGTTNIRQYAMYYNLNPLAVYFPSELVSISVYAFYNCTNTRFPNFSSLTHLTSVGGYVFSYDANSGIYTDALPSSLKTIGAYAFQNGFADGQAIHFPALTSLGEFSFGSASGVKKAITSITYDANFAIATMPQYTYANLQVSGPFTVPASVKTLGTYMAYGSRFTNYTIPSTVTKLNDRCFNGNSSEANSNYASSWFKFERVTPPTFGSNIFAPQMLTNGIKFYVPDESVDAYKTASNFTSYASYVYPVSQMP